MFGNQDRAGRKVWPGLCLLGLAIAGGPFATRGETQTPAVDPRAWEDLDIVPMPKEIRLTDDDLLLDPDRVVIVIGAAAGRQSEIGSEWINQRLAEVGGTAELPILSGTDIPSDKTVLIIGTVDDNPLIAEAVNAGLVNVGPDNPGERGYEIRRSGDGRRIYLAGADPIGALYACVTFGELLEQREGAVVWRSAEVRDWPDFLNVQLGSSRMAEIEALTGWQYGRIRNAPPTPAFRENYLRVVRATKDRLLRRKVSSFLYSYGWERHRHAPDESIALVREGIDYGVERGIGALYYAAKPFVGLKADYPDVESELHVPWGRYAENWIRGWAPRFDEIRTETARDLARFVSRVGYTDLGFHDTDTGGYHSPAQWESRDEESRERWGDDYAAATVHKHMIYYRALKAVNPDLRIHFTLYPYNITALEPDPDSPRTSMPAGGQDPRVRERVVDIWRTWAEDLPEDVTFCIRENFPETVHAFRELWPHGLFTWYGFDPRAWAPLVIEQPSFMRTYFRNRRDFMYPVIMGEYYVPLKGLAAVEYAWNVQAPGASDWRRITVDEMAACEREAVIYHKVYPRVVRNLFGRGAAPDVWEAVQQNIDPHHIFEEYLRRAPRLLDTAARMNEQAQRAEVGAAALDRVLAGLAAGDYPDMDERGRFYHAYLREYFHTSLWTARIRARKMEAVERARAQELDAAGESLAEAEALIDAATPALAEVLEQRPAGLVRPVQRKFMADGAGSHGWADHQLGLDALRERTTLMAAELPVLARPIPADVVETLARDRLVRVARTEEAVRIAGGIEDPVWEQAWAVEAFFVLNPGEGYVEEIAHAYTRARLLYDDENLYVGVEAWFAAGAPREGREDETVEILLTPPVEEKGEEGFVRFVIGANGHVIRHQARRCGATGRWFHDREWTVPGGGLETAVHSGPERWTAAMSIPLRAISSAGLRGWTINLSRYAVLARNREWSATQAPGSENNHDLAGFRPLVFAARGQRHVPDVRLDPRDVRVEAETFPDGVATAAGFGMRVVAGQVLNNAVIRAETYGPDGDKEWAGELAPPNRIYYRWESAPPHFRVRFGGMHEKGGIRVIVKSEEGTFERWIRVGGWEGVPGAAGGLFAPGREGTMGLGGECFFPDRVEREGSVREVFHREAGTVEFHFMPSRDWESRAPGGAIRLSNYTLLHYGPIQRNHPNLVNRSPLAVRYDPRRGRLTASMYNRMFAGWNVASAPFAWPEGEGRHVAVVWEVSARESDRLRLYVDGRRVSGAPGYQNRDRLPEVVEEMLETTFPYNIQVGSLNSGWEAMEGVLDGLRISRTARYREDFSPERGAFVLDRETSARFHFNGTLEGEGMTPGGARYPLRAQAGIISHHAGP